MGSRKSVYVSHHQRADGGEPPNQFLPSVTVDLRVFYPPTGKPNLEIALDCLDGAYNEARDELKRRMKGIDD